MIDREKKNETLGLNREASEKKIQKFIEDDAGKAVEEDFIYRFTKWQNIPEERRGHSYYDDMPQVHFYTEKDYKRFQDKFLGMPYTREYQNRPAEFWKHEERDVQIMMHYMEQKLSKPLTPDAVLGPPKSKKDSYMKSIMPAKVLLAEKMKLKSKYEKPNPKLHPKDRKRQKAEQELQEKMEDNIYHYRDRLLPRFKVL